LDFHPEIRFITVGGIAHTKGQHDVIKALYILKDDLLNFRCQFIGEVRDKSYLNYLLELAEKLNISDKLTIHTGLSDRDRDIALEQADIYIQPSHEEGFCFAVFEASSRVPRLVGTDVGAISAGLRGLPGVEIIPPRQPEKLAAAIRKLIEVSLTQSDMNERQISLGIDLSQESYFNDHLQIYKDLISCG
jgi:colanic acid/amylovoran biosynthesis glycosyltransferase